VLLKTACESCSYRFDLVCRFANVSLRARERIDVHARETGSSVHHAVPARQNQGHVKINLQTLVLAALKSKLQLELTEKR